jgi:NADH-quinone oxidoreductase subunit H
MERFLNTFWTDPIGFLISWFVGVLRGWSLTEDWVVFISYLVGAMILAVCSLLLVVFLIWVERKIGGRVQDRLGPNRVGPFGLIQPVADMLKIFTKEFITPDGVDKVAYNLAPILAVGAVIMIWAVVPFGITLFGSNLNVGILYIVAVGGLGELGIILAGWGSNNKFALLGAFRAVAQLLSYEVPMVVSLLVPVMLSGSMNLNEIVRAQTVPFIVMAPVAALIFFISSIAENGRAPFDLLEAESEIVAGFNVEYSGLKFGFFFVGDFLHAFTIALLFSVLFLGGWNGPAADTIPILGFVYLMIKTSIMYFLGLLIRFSLPRFRIDQMMALNWKLLVPLSLVTVVMTAIVDKLAPPLAPIIERFNPDLAKTVAAWGSNGDLLVKVFVLILTNLIIWLTLQEVLAYAFRKYPPRKAVTHSRPAPETPAVQS